MKKLVSLVLLASFTSCKHESKENDSATKQTISGVKISSPVFTTVPSAQMKKFDVSDISYLWPNYGNYVQDTNANKPKLDYLEIISTNENENLIPSVKDLEDIMKFSYGVGSFNIDASNANFKLMNPYTETLETSVTATDSFLETELDKIFISSFRIDDCGAGLHQGNNKTTFSQWKKVTKGQTPILETLNDVPCVSMLRLVASPYTINGIGDTAIHLIYTFKDPQILNFLINDLQYLKAKSPAKTDGVMLGVHPGFLKQGSEAFSKDVIKFIKHYAKRDFLTNLAFISTLDSSGGDTWAMFEAEYDENRKMSMKPFHFINGSPISQGFLPRISTLDKKNIRAGTPVVGLVNDDRTADVKSKADDYRQIIDPRRSFTSQVECRSCHVESNAFVEMAAKNDNAQIKDIFNKAENIYYIKGITGFPNPKYLPLNNFNFRALGWFNTFETVSVRTATTTAAVASSINKRLFNDPSGNGKNCSEQQHLIFQCIIKSFGQETNNCMNRCN